MSASPTLAGFEQALAHLLPPGAAWPRDPASVWMRLLAGLAATLDEHHQVVQQTAREWLPQLTHTRLAEWEAATGLPDGCAATTLTEEQRRGAVLARLRGYLGPYDDSSPAAPGVIADYCAELGHPEATVTYNYPFRCGHNRVGDRLGVLDGKLWVRISGDADAQALLQCALERVVPARFAIHVILV